MLATIVIPTSSVAKWSHIGGEQPQIHLIVPSGLLVQYGVPESKREGSLQHLVDQISE